MKKLLSSEETNTGRQTEFDHMKGIFMLFIYLIHAYQATGSDKGPFVSCIYIFATMSGAAIYIFVAGFGTAYDKSSSPASLCARGVRLVAYQYMTNILYALSLLIPYPFIARTLESDQIETFRVMMQTYLQFINIFFITGIIYLVLALLKKLRLPLALYPVLAVVTALAAPLLYGTKADIPVIGYVCSLLIGEAPFVSFTPLYFLSYALIGVAAGNVYRRICDKALFYKRMILVSAGIILIWWVSVYVRIRGSVDEWGYITDIASFEEVMDYAYSCPDLWHVLASIAHVMLFAGILYFIRDHIAAQFLYYGRNITLYYALHLVPYLIAFAMHGYTGFGEGFVLILTLISMIVTEVIVRFIVRKRLKIIVN